MTKGVNSEFQNNMEAAMITLIADRDPVTEALNRIEQDTKPRPRLIGRQIRRINADEIARLCAANDAVRARVRYDHGSLDLSGSNSFNAQMHRLLFSTQTGIWRRLFNRVGIGLGG